MEFLTAKLLKSPRIRKKILLLFATLVLLSPKSSATEWVFNVRVEAVEFLSHRPMQKPEDYIEHTKRSLNLVNLSFFTKLDLIGPYKDRDQWVTRSRKKWPMLYISDERAQIHSYNEKPPLSYHYAASGYPILLKNGSKTKIRRSYFTTRKCPRTIIGIDRSGNLLIYITTSSTLKDAQERLQGLGCVDAINFDGGSSTCLYLNGNRVYSSKLRRRYPSMLSWS